ncbi:MAG: hypothetical protein QM783_01590 [Phycisphaerales bacterium]
MERREMECWETLVRAVEEGNHLDHYVFQDMLDGVYHFTEADGDLHRDVINIVVWPPYTPLKKSDAAQLLSQYQALEGMVSPQMINRWWEYSLAHGWIPLEIVAIRQNWRR